MAQLLAEHGARIKVLEVQSENHEKRIFTMEELGRNIDKKLDSWSFALKVVLWIGALPTSFIVLIYYIIQISKVVHG